MLTLPWFFNLEKVSEMPRVWEVARAAIGVNLLVETKGLNEGKRDGEWVLWFFNWNNPAAVDFKEIAITVFFFDKRLEGFLSFLLLSVLKIGSNFYEKFYSDLDHCICPIIIKNFLVFFLPLME